MSASLGKFSLIVSGGGGNSRKENLRVRLSRDLDPTCIQKTVAYLLNTLVKVTLRHLFQTDERSFMPRSAEALVSVDCCALVEQCAVLEG